MSQRSVEQVIGRLATDEDFRQRFDRSRDTALAEVVANGLQLTPVEQRALLDLDVTACERFAGCLDPRIQKISIRRNAS
jgi:Ribosomally synthesized peptide prototyped by Frankia Franean1_4349.